MADPYYGEIRTVGFNYAPAGWAMCNGQILPIQQNTPLFSILGTQYGGDGVRTFGLPNLNGYVAMGQGSGPGLTPRIPGEATGSPTVTLLTTEMPQHTHPAMSVDAAATTGAATNGAWAQQKYGRVARRAFTGTQNVTMRPDALGLAGGGQAHNNLPPVLGLCFIICLSGIFPPRP
ncbi:phage tail protein [Agromyces soli]|uniref:Tail fiber protein n=1 Tax=Agromyces soli TaxID=659012 RepID=A0ABY4AZN6_9MICO|nr:tail fiber protein [Agromyces soli]UOE27288.1 tail fiber protein [Agromyces soli]